MAANTSFTCRCGVEKKTSNHWILATRSAGTIRFTRWDAGMAREADVIVLCGERCAAALLSRSMGTWKENSATESTGKGLLPTAA